MTPRLWVLGAGDPEMAAIERLLLAAGEEVLHAVTAGRDGSATRVHPGNAYSVLAALVAGRPWTTVIPGASSRVVLVECGWPQAWPGRELYAVATCDHHREGDPGFGRPAREFWPASSLGQVVAALGLAVSEDVSVPERPYRWTADDGGPAPAWVAAIFPADEALLVAAGDHCPGAAYRGECPGVDPEALATWRAASRAAFQGRPVADVLADVRRADQVIAAVLLSPPYASEEEWEEGVPMIWVSAAPGHPRAVNVTPLPGGTLPELPEAALRAGVATIALVADRDGRRKLVLGGASPDQPALVADWVRQARTGWVAGWAVDPATVYGGDPARGFAGAYLAGAAQ